MLELKKDQTKSQPPSLSVNPYREDEHFAEIGQWLTDRGLGVMPPWFLSKIGWVVDGVACGFLYLTNSKVAYFDAFISNKSQPKSVRDAAFDEIVKTLLIDAERHGVKLIVCQTKHSAIERLTTKFGFTGTGEERGYSKRL